MNIIVCLKQVPDTTEVKINPETNTLMREGVRSIINPFDNYALEEGVRLKERYGGAVKVLSMGPPQAKEALTESISLGADDAYLLCDRAFAGADTLATSYALSQGIQKTGPYDLIICGRQAIDGDTGQVGPGIAEHLGIAFVGMVRKIREVEAGRAVVERMTDDGYEVINCTLPAVFSVVKEINEPRVPSLRGKMRARSYQVTTWTAAEIAADTARTGLKGSPTQVVRIFTPKRRGRGEMLNGDTGEKVSALFDRLREAGVV
ncbi:MAG TPA: electron transfer flavoprotein subunit beta/FixA family protein [Firmicutes bacterium]|nr:electron transfer flavoprotein subunit beta/FixA family protein [Bacillota bacterium]